MGRTACTETEHQYLYKGALYLYLLGLHVEWAIFLSHFKQIWSFSSDFRRSPPVCNSTKIRPAAAELIQTETHTDTTKLIGVFRYIFANAPKNLKEA